MKVQNSWVQNVSKISGHKQYQKMIFVYVYIKKKVLKMKTNGNTVLANITEKTVEHKGKKKSTKIQNDGKIYSKKSRQNNQIFKYLKRKKNSTG